jgi:D-arabinose 1-dehydrogenase-like Zn-dependent alcohol dehydrogenase
MATIDGGKGVFCLAAFDKTMVLKKHEIGRPEAGPTDVSFSIQYCGMCHSDVHACNGDWGLEFFPISPGHELVGLVTAVGSDVKDFKVGDRVGTGCMVESCNSCEQCNVGLEQHCPSMVQTYGTTFPEGKGENMAKAAGYHTSKLLKAFFCMDIRYTSLTHYGIL